MANPWRRRVVRGTAGALTAIVIVALVRVLRRDGPAVLAAWRAASVRWPWIALATACGLAGYAIYVVGWRRLLTDSSVHTSFWELVRLFLVSNLGRYLPGGKAWQVGIVGLMASENGLPAAIVAGSSLLQGLVGVAVGAVLLLATGGAALGVAAGWLALPVAGLAGLLAAPVVLQAWPRVRMAVVRRLPSAASVTIATMWALVWTAAASWIAWGIALYALARGLLSEPGASVVTYVAAWIGPFLAGLIAVMTPAGLGVRDGVMHTMLATAGVAGSAAMVLVVVARVWVTALEVVPALAVLAIRWHAGRATTGMSPRKAVDTTPMPHRVE